MSCQADFSGPYGWFFFSVSWVISQLTLVNVYPSYKSSLCLSIAIVDYFSNCYMQFCRIPIVEIIHNFSCMVKIGSKILLLIFDILLLFDLKQYFFFSTFLASIISLTFYFFFLCWLQQTIVMDCIGQLKGWWSQAKVG